MNVAKKEVVQMGKKGDDTKTFIKQEAYQLFAKKGFKEVTMKDICEATGLSRGGLYRHYESTDKIFSEIISSFLIVQDNEFKEKIKNNISGIQILNQILEKYSHEMLDAKNSLNLAIYEYFSSKELNESENLLSQQYISSYGSWEALIQYGISRGEFKKVDARGIFNLIIFSYQGVRMYSRLMNIGSDVPEKIAEQIKYLLVAE